MKFFYQSLPYYAHKVYKFVGQIRSEHEELYRAEYSKRNSLGTYDNPNGYAVRVFDEYKGNRIYENGELFRD